MSTPQLHKTRPQKRPPEWFPTGSPLVPHTPWVAPK